MEGKELEAVWEVIPLKSLNGHVRKHLADLATFISHDSILLRLLGYILIPLDSRKDF